MTRPEFIAYLNSNLGPEFATEASNFFRNPLQMLNLISDCFLEVGKAKIDVKDISPRRFTLLSVLGSYELIAELKPALAEHLQPGNIVWLAYSMGRIDGKAEVDGQALVDEIISVADKAEEH